MLSAEWPGSATARSSQRCHSATEYSAQQKPEAAGGRQLTLGSPCTLPSAYLSNFALQAVAAQHHKAFMQLQRKQKLLDEQHDSMSTIVKNIDERNSKAIADIRTHLNTFLTELISVVGRQFEKVKADLGNSHAETIRVGAAALLRAWFKFATLNMLHRAPTPQHTHTVQYSKIMQTHGL